MRRPSIFRLLKIKILHILATKFPFPSSIRVRIQALRGVKFIDKSSVFIGENVTFDGVYPENITIGKDVMITRDVVILTHYYVPSCSMHKFRTGKVFIGDNVFIGLKSAIVSDLVIADGAIIGAGSVVNRDVAINSIVGGVPARVLGKRGDKQSFR